MFEEAIELYSILTPNAAKFSNIIGTIRDLIIKNEYEVEPLDTTRIKLDIIKQNEDFFLNIFMESLNRAVQLTEYKRNIAFISNIRKIISDNIHSILNEIAFEGISGGFKVMRRVAGDWSDFYEGVEQTRSILGVKETSPTSQKVKFWKEVVWPDDILYDYTINIRLQAWGNLAPYWLFIEHGNVGRSGAYPKFSPTNFFSTAVQIIESEMKTMIITEQEKFEKGKNDIEFEEKEMNVILQAAERFLNNPQDFNPGDILGTITNILNQKRYKVYITPTTKVGVTRIR